MSLKVHTVIHSWDKGVIVCDRELQLVMVYKVVIKPPKVFLELVDSFAFPKFNFCVIPVSVAYVTVTSDKEVQMNSILVSDRHKNGGVYQLDIFNRTWKILIKNGLDSEVAHGICVQAENLIVTDKRNNIILKYNLQSGSQDKFGDGKCHTADGVLSSCSFVQPTKVCIEHSTVYILDPGYKYSLCDHIYCCIS